jgi:hypothetical protein
MNSVTEAQHVSPWSLGRGPEGKLETALFGILAPDAKVQQAEGGAVPKAGQFSRDLTGTAKPRRIVHRIDPGESVAS